MLLIHSPVGPLAIIIASIIILGPAITLFTFGYLKRESNKNLSTICYYIASGYLFMIIIAYYFTVF